MPAQLQPATVSSGIGTSPPIQPPVVPNYGQVAELMSSQGAGVDKQVAGRSANPPTVARSAQDQLLRCKLGPFVGLFYALRAKHPPAASHCLRVALGCSKWAEFCNLPNEQRDLLEIAGLLHDLGKIGVPDHILQKPEALNNSEQLAMELTVDIGLEILASTGASPQLLEIIRLARQSYDQLGNASQLPCMLQIVDAYDAMTTAQVFRQALSRERSIAELCEKAGSQFEPKLVKSFVEMVIEPRPELEQKIALRWLTELNTTSYFSGMDCSTGSQAVDNLVNTLFHSSLLKVLSDAAIYLDTQGKILAWNQAAEVLTGQPSSSVLHCQWSPKMAGLLNLDGSAITDCPLQQSLKTNTRHLASLQLKQPSGKVLQVDLTTIPLFTEQGSFAGFVVLIRDDSVQTDLESRVRTLHQIATQDPLTKVANRNELNRELESTILSHSSSGTPAAVIMCDIDYFKRINDTYSHQAGDDALVTFAGLLRDSARKDDLVARYGGEEFVILCQACDISAAHARAEDLRRLVERTPVPSLGNSQMTASFGVTVLQPGDNMETLIARADRALMTAKQTGRNRVVQLGSGGRNPSTSEADGRRAAADAEPRRSNWLSWFTSSEAPVCKREYLSAVPFGVAIQKLEGFVGDHKAEIVSTDADRVTIRVVGGQNGRRRGEHGIAMLMQVDIQQVEFFTSGRNRAYQSRTKFAVQLHPVRPRDRRHSVIDGQAHQILLSFQAYIVGEEIDEQLRKSIILPR